VLQRHLQRPPEEAREEGEGRERERERGAHRRSKEVSLNSLISKEDEGSLHGSLDSSLSPDSLLLSHLL
jgi:hypothetical protein